MERTLAKMVTGLLLLWFVSWTPYAVMSMWTMFFKAEGLTQSIAIFPTILCKMSGTLNAFIYGIRFEFIEQQRVSFVAAQEMLLT